MGKFILNSTICEQILTTVCGPHAPSGKFYRSVRLRYWVSAGLRGCIVGLWNVLEQMHLCADRRKTSMF